MTADVVAVLNVGDYFFGRSLAGHQERVRHPNQRQMPSFARARGSVGLSAEQGGGRARIQKAAEHAAIYMHHAAPASAFVVVAIVPVAAEGRVRARGENRRADGFSD